MTDNLNDPTDLQSRLKELEEENELLLLQLHQVQEELEHYYLRNQELEKAQPPAQSAPAPAGWVDDELPEVLAENRRLNALVEVQRAVRQHEARNALNVRLGNILIDAVQSGALLSVPPKLLRIWRESKRRTPPKALGGESFDEVVAAYNQGGFDAVEELLAKASVGPLMQGKAYMALTRHLMKYDRAAAAEAARRAHARDPKPNRLKWVAFRLHEAGEVIEAEAMLDVLPPETSFSDSEKRRASQIRREAQYARQHEAKQRTGYAERRAAIERQLRTLTEEKEAQTRLANERQQRIEQLGREKNAIEQEKAALTKELDQLKGSAARTKEENELLLSQLHQTQERLEQALLEKEKIASDRADMEQVAQALQADVAALKEQIETLRRSHARLEEEKAAITRWHEEAERLAEELNREVGALKQAQVQSEQQRQELAEQVQRLAAEKKAREAELLGEIETLRQQQVKTEQEKVALVKWHDELVVMVEERNRQIETLQKAQAQFEQVHRVLTERYEGQLKSVVELKAQIEQLKAQSEIRKTEFERQIEALKQEKTKLEQEIRALAEKADQAEKRAAEQLKRANELQQQIEQRSANEAEMATRQQRMYEEMVRAEAQIDLIKDMLLREPGL